jgi:hypothetical protein
MKFLIAIAAKVARFTERFLLPYSRRLKRYKVAYAKTEAHCKSKGIVVGVQTKIYLQDYYRIKERDWLGK